MENQVTPSRQFAGGTKCAIDSCGNRALSQGIYCAECKPKARNRLRRPHLTGPTDEHQTDVYAAMLDPMQRQRIRRYGTQPCAIPDCGQPCLPGRALCSSRCRSRVSGRKPIRLQIEVDGVRGTIAEHAARLGITVSAISHRLKKGMSLQDALIKPMKVPSIRMRKVGVTMDKMPET